MRHRDLAYVVDYLSPAGTLRGRETCRVSVHGDGQRTARTVSEIFDTEILRDVTLTVDRAFRPIEAFVRTRQHDRLLGSGWFRFEGTMAEAECWSPSEGRSSQRLALASPAKSFLSHAVTLDVWHAAGISHDAAAGVQGLSPLPTCSPLHNGATAPRLGLWPLSAAFVGIETVETPAGRFEALHERLYEADGTAFLETWCSADEDRVMLRMHYPVYDTMYVLAKLER
ncbi:MAG: hypothetical protein OHK0024_16480 [Thalassobaculales bacterium]